MPLLLNFDTGTVLLDGLKNSMKTHTEIMIVSGGGMHYNIRQYVLITMAVPCHSLRNETGTTQLKQLTVDSENTTDCDFNLAQYSVIPLLGDLFLAFYSVLYKSTHLKLLWGRNRFS